VGNGIAGATAAEELAEQEPDSDITVVTDEDRPLYNRILLKSHTKGKLPLQTAQVHTRDWYQERDIDLHLETRIEDVLLDEKKAFSTDGEAFDYDRLLVATGGAPRRLPQDDGYDNLHYMWDWDDAAKIGEQAEKAEKAVVVGGGLLGIDLAVSFAEQGCDTRYLIRGDRWFRRGLGSDGAEMVHQALEDKGVEVLTNTEVAELDSENGHVETVVTDEGRRIETDEVGVAIGQTPNSAFIDVDKNEKDQIKANERLQTSDSDVFAAGDQVEYRSPIFGRTSFGSWGHSEAMGRCAARNMIGDEERVFKHVNTYGVGHFDFAIESVGQPGLDSEEIDADGEVVCLHSDAGILTGATAVGSSIEWMCEHISEGAEPSQVRERIDG
jgi:NAD(P)H-nitrite reductase